MTANRNLKQRIRARARKTGESYTAARHQLAEGRSSVTVAAAQLPLLPDPGDASQIRASGDAVRALMREARTRGAGLVHFPEGALTSPGKRVMSSTGPDDIGPADWDRADWAGLARELDEITLLAGQLRLWTVVGGIRRSASDVRPANCLFIISSRGRLTGRYPRQPGSPRHLRHRGGWARRRQLPLGQLRRPRRGQRSAGWPGDPRRHLGRPVRGGCAWPGRR